MADSSLSGRAEELRQETVALNQLLSSFASKADVKTQLEVERARNRELIRARDRVNTFAVGCLVVALMVVGLFVWRLSSLADENHRNACTFVAKHDLLVDKVEEAARLVNVPAPDRDPAVQAELDQFVSNYVATVEVARVPRGDC